MMNAFHGEIEDAQGKLDPHIAINAHIHLGHMLHANHLDARGSNFYFLRGTFSSNNYSSSGSGGSSDPGPVNNSQEESSGFPSLRKRLQDNPKGQGVGSQPYSEQERELVGAVLQPFSSGRPKRKEPQEGEPVHPLEEYDRATEK